MACGGATATDLFGDLSSDAGTSPTGTSTSTSTVPTTSPTTPPVPTPTTNPTTPPPDKDAGTRDASDASRIDSGRDAGAVGIACGTSTCPAADTCCASYNAAGGTYTFQCRAGQVTCTEPSTQINCDSAEDCAGSGTNKICCGDRVTSGGGGYYDNVKCAATCGGNDVIFCNPATPTVSCGARPCQESTLLRGYYVCN